MEALIRRLVRGLSDSNIVVDANVIRWASPIPSFGDPSRARVASLGLNPSNREFEDIGGKELDGPKRRFHTLGSLRINDWSEVRDNHLDMILEKCRNYFLLGRNAFDIFFKPLDRILTDTGASYYGPRADACHLDLVPYATKPKWAELGPSKQSILLCKAEKEKTLGELLRDSPIQLLVLNGASVVRNFQKMTRENATTGAALSLTRVKMDDWTLRRRSGSVPGFAYSGVANSLSGIPLNRELKVLGFNHFVQFMPAANLSAVRNSMRAWVGLEAIA